MASGPCPARMSARRSATAANASFHDTATSSSGRAPAPFPRTLPRTRGSTRRSSAFTASKPKRPLSHNQLWFSGSLSMPSSRVTRFDEDCTAARHPNEHSVHVDSTWSRSQGRAVNR